MIDLAAMLAQHMRSAAAPPPVVRPDKPPAGRAPTGGRVTKVETRLVNGKWVLVPVEWGQGKVDKALIPRVTVTPIQRPPL